MNLQDDPSKNTKSFLKVLALLFIAGLFLLTGYVITVTTKYDSTTSLAGVADAQIDNRMPSSNRIGSYNGTYEVLIPNGWRGVHYRQNDIVAINNIDSLQGASANVIKAEVFDNDPLLTCTVCIYNNPSTFVQMPSGTQTSKQFGRYSVLRFERRDVRIAGDSEYTFVFPANNSGRMTVYYYVSPGAINNLDAIENVVASVGLK